MNASGSAFFFLFLDSFLLAISLHYSNGGNGNEGRQAGKSSFSVT
jgi:hypothetical protein